MKRAISICQRWSSTQPNQANFFFQFQGLSISVVVAGVSYKLRDELRSRFTIRHQSFRWEVHDRLCYARIYLEFLTSKAQVSKALISTLWSYHRISIKGALLSIFFWNAECVLNMRLWQKNLFRLSPIAMTTHSIKIAIHSGIKSLQWFPLFMMNFTASFFFVSSHYTNCQSLTQHLIILRLKNPFDLAKQDKVFENISSCVIITLHVFFSIHPQIPFTECLFA